MPIPDTRAAKAVTNVPALYISRNPRQLPKFVDLQRVFFSLSLHSMCDFPEAVFFPAIVVFSLF
jgi:hypothetical protein